jgi:hypothetical protein
MYCENWLEYPPDIINVCGPVKKNDTSSYYEDLGYVVLKCNACLNICVWTRQAWVGRIAKLFIGRKLTISKLRDAVKYAKVRSNLKCSVQGAISSSDGKSNEGGAEMR